MGNVPQPAAPEELGRSQASRRPRVRRGPPRAATALLAFATAASHASGDGACNARFEPPGGFPGKATEYNGASLPDTCFLSHGSHHVFVIGSWGGVQPESGGPPTPADYKLRAVTADDRDAQQQVAKAMEERAGSLQLDYVLNVGGNFHKTGLDAHCDVFNEPANTHQWSDVFEEVYGGELSTTQWLGVLGSVDYGGSTFTSGWPAQIAYTWEQPPPWSGRWILPSQYYSARAVYSDFTVEYFFVDSNRWSALPKELDPENNVCGELHAQDLGPAICTATGPLSLDECEGWFQALWDKEMTWLREALEKSTAEWQIVVTHIHPDPDQWEDLARDFGIDLFLTGQEPRQEVLYLDNINALRPTGVINAGGGGGLISKEAPDPSGKDSQYGFVDLTLSKETIKVELVSHGGKVVDSATIHQRSLGEEYDNNKDYSHVRGSSARETTTVDSLAMTKTTTAEQVDSLAMTKTTTSVRGSGSSAKPSSTSEAPSQASEPTQAPVASEAASAAAADMTEIGSDGFDASLQVTPLTDITESVNDTVVFNFVVESVDYDALVAQESTEAAMVKGLREVVANVTEVGVQGVEVNLSRGSVAVETIVHAGDKSASEIRIALASSQEFGLTLSKFLHELEGMEAVSTGLLKFRPAGAPTIIKAPRPKTAARTQQTVIPGIPSTIPGSIPSSIPDNAIWAGCAGAAVATLSLIVCLVCRRSSEDSKRLPVSTQEDNASPLSSKLDPLNSAEGQDMKTRVNALLTRRPGEVGGASRRGPATSPGGSARSRSQSPQDPSGRRAEGSSGFFTRTALFSRGSS